MEYQIFLALSILCLVVTIVFLYMLKNKLDNTKEKLDALLIENARNLQIIEDLRVQIEKTKSENSLHVEALNGCKNSLQNELLHKATLNAKIEAQNESYEKLQESFESQAKKLELKLEQIMQENLEIKLKKFDESSIKSLSNILIPFKQNIDEFKLKIESSQEDATKKFASLATQIEFVQRAGLNISKEAQNLTEALKGKKQMQGSWGEMILESVLEYSGLLNGVHYETQESFKEDGKIYRPDVIVKLPKNRSAIIDSKVSLVDYDAFVRAEDELQKSTCRKSVVRAFKNHIDTLSAKEYVKYQSGTLQYIFMFVPIEGAFSLAVQEDPMLYEYALKKHIAIVTPSTLTVSLRTIYLYWQSENSTANANSLFEEAGKIYDKMYIFSENFIKIGVNIEKLHKDYDNAKSQLMSGSGNLLTRATKLKTLGAKTTKELSKIAQIQSDEVVLLEE